MRYALAVACLLAATLLAAPATAQDLQSSSECVSLTVPPKMDWQTCKALAQDVFDLVDEIGYFADECTQSLRHCIGNDL